jgi:ELWxxDGT repeat protein
VETDWAFVYYFVADDGIIGKELWRTDGTLVNNYYVKDTNPGAADGVISLIGP